MECLASGHRSSLVSPLFFSRVVVFVFTGSGGYSTDRLCSLMNLLISISGLFSLPLILLKLSSIARHKLVTLPLVQRLFPFFHHLTAHSVRQVAILKMLFLNVLKASVVRWMLSLWVLSVWLSVHLFLTEMELRKWQYVCVCHRVMGVTEDAEWPLPKGVGEQLTTVCIYLCVHGSSFNIRYRMHYMFSLQICAHSQRWRPIPTGVNTAHSQKKLSLWKMRGHRCWDRKTCVPCPNEHYGSLYSGPSISDTPNDVQRLNS